MVCPESVRLTAGPSRRGLTGEAAGSSSTAVGPPGRPVLGLVALADVRPEARAGGLAARAAGIRPTLVTGDHPDTAAAVAARRPGLRAAGPAHRP